MWAGTFHAVGARLLRREAALAQRTPSFTIYDEDDALTAVKRAMDRLQLSAKQWAPAAIRRAISDAKNALVAPAEYASLALDPLSRAAARVYELLDRTLARFERRGLRRPARAPGAHPPAAPRAARRVPRALPLSARGRVPGHEPRAVPAREAPRRRARQRAGGGRRRPVDLRLARRRHPEHPRFREGLPGGARSCASRRTTAPRRRCSRSRTPRSRRTSAAWGRRCAPRGPPGAKVTVAGCLDERDEAEFVADEIVAGRAADRGLMLRDIAVLYRTNAQSRSLEEVLRRRGRAVPARRRGALLRPARDPRPHGVSQADREPRRRRGLPPRRRGAAARARRHDARRARRGARATAGVPDARGGRARRPRRRRSAPPRGRGSPSSPPSSRAPARSPRTPASTRSSAR